MFLLSAKDLNLFKRENKGSRDSLKGEACLFFLNKGLKGSFL